jgi:hypothetical protein
MQACDSDRHALANIKSLDSDLDPGRMAGPASGAGLLAMKEVWC